MFSQLAQCSYQVTHNLHIRYIAHCSCQTAVNNQSQDHLYEAISPFEKPFIVSGGKEATAPKSCINVLCYILHSECHFEIKLHVCHF